MLKSLFIKNFALISEIDLNFESGLTILTGETGAGKSIIIDAISLLAGESANDDFIKNNQNEALIEGVFEIKNQKDSQLFPDEFKDFFEEGSNEIIILRKISKNKGNTAKINNQSISLKKLKEFSKYLISITNQFEHLLLFDREKQLNLIDTFIMNESSTFCSDLEDFKKKYKNLYHNYQNIKLKLTQLSKDNLELSHKLELLNYQIQDLETQNFQINEEEDLKQQQQKIKYQKTIGFALTELTTNLTFISEKTHQNISTIDKLIKKIDNPIFPKLNEKFSQFFIEVNDALEETKKQESLISEVDDEDLEKIEARLDLLFKYKTKYKTTTVLELCDLLKAFKIEYRELTNQDLNKEVLTKELESTERELASTAEVIHKIRLNKAKIICDLMNMHLKDLNFKHTDFRINLDYQENDFFINGRDKIAFLISLNLGEPVKPIEKVASGGELSRILLALKTVFYENSEIGTTIFDEIDTGIGGITALKVGEKMRLIAKNTQVLAVTHLPQIAKFCHHHYVIEKNFENNTTSVRVKKLLETEKLSEIKRMIGGKEIVDILK